MKYKITIAGYKKIILNSGNNILEAALDQDIDFPHGCRSGNCGACKSRLISGEVDMMPYSEFALEDAEKENSFILACRAIPKSNCTLEILDKNKEEQIKQIVKEFSYNVSKIKKFSADILVVQLENQNDKELDFLAGQYAELKFGDLDFRQFSMANSPSEKILEFHIKRQNNGLVSNYIFEELNLNEKVLLKGPYGNSYLREKHRGPILGVAGGTGLAPILSIVNSSQEKKMKQPINLYIGASKENDFYYLDQLSILKKSNNNFNFFPILSGKKNSEKYRTGLVTDAVLEDIEDFDGFKVYLAGPPPMVEAAEKFFPNLGLNKNDIHADAFYNKFEEMGKND